MKTVEEIADELGIKHRDHRMLCQNCGKKNDWHCTSLGTGENGLPLGGPCPLCELCFQILTPQERLPFYLRLHKYQEATSKLYEMGFNTKWEDVESSVLAGR